MFGEQSKENSQLDQENLLKKEAIPPPEEPKQIKLFKLEKQFKSGANWFYLIGGLSIVNSLLILSGKNLSFIIGLGATQLVDGMMLSIMEETGAPAFKYIGFGFDVIIAGIYVVIGFFANKQYKAAFILGMIFYVLDGLIFLLVMDILSIGFHVFVLLCIFVGLKKLMQLEKLRRVPQLAKPTTENTFGS